MKIIDNRITKSMSFGCVHIGEVFRPVDDDVYHATVYMRIPVVEDDNGDYLNAVALDEGYLGWFADSEQVEQLNTTLYINPKGE